jgi:Xaa-Pro aminopeptidase
MVTSTDWGQELIKRRAEIWTAAQVEDCDLLLVYATREHAETFRYLTNFVPALGDMWGVMTGPEQMACFLNFHWELLEAGTRSGLPDWQGIFDPVPAVMSRVKDASPRRIAVLGLRRLPWVAYQLLSEEVPGIDLVDIGHHLDQIRRIKSPLEIALLKEGARITDLAFAEIRECVRPGISEDELAALVVYVFRREGAGLAFDPLVMGGLDRETAVIARSTRPRPLEQGDTLMIDIGAAFEGYQVDVSRTMVLGEPTALQHKIWDTILEVHETVVSMSRPGVPCVDLHHAAVGIINRAGFEFKHRIGHGFGLATSFEWPSLDSETAPLQPGMTIAIEPGIYEVGAGAMKLEDSLVITKAGCEVISTCSRALEPMPL